MTTNTANASGSFGERITDASGTTAAGAAAVPSAILSDAIIPALSSCFGFGIVASSSNTRLFGSADGDTRAELLKKKAVVPGRSSASELVKRVSSNDRDFRMPPKGEALSPDQIALLKAWIDETPEGVMAAFAGVVLASRYTSGQPNTSIGFELDVISACVLGGVSLTGGVGSMAFVVAGVLIQSYGPQPVFIGGGALAVGLSLGALLVPSIRHLRA